MKIALVGWGVETKSAYNYYGDDHQYLIVSEESRSDFPTAMNVGIQSLKGDRKPGLTGNVEDLSYLEGLDDCDLIIFTASSRKNLEKVYDSSHLLWNKAKTILHVFFEKCQSENIVGVTGTKGKGTTTTLISMMLEASGKTVHVGGNIGIAVLDLLPEVQADDWVVLELSSFQLNKFPYSPHIAVHLMMIPEHIDEWHKTIDDYVESKRNIFAHQTSEDLAIYNPYNEYSKSNVEASSGTHIPYLMEPGAHTKGDAIIIESVEIIKTSDIALPGAHNIENVCAAISAVWQVSKDKDALRGVLATFKGLEHRLQLVREVNGIRYYDDSFGTTPDTSVVAMDAFVDPKVMIVGGHDKGNDYTRMIRRLNSEDIHGIVCLGTTGTKIASELISKGYDKEKIIVKDNYNDWNISQIIQSANSFAEKGDIILLSTGSASFGIFKDYKDRGCQFIDAVNQL